MQSGDCFVAQALSFFCSSDGRHAVVCFFPSMIVPCLSVVSAWCCPDVFYTAVLSPQHVRWFLRSFECGGLAEDHDHEVLMSPQETNLYLSSVLGLACVYRVANLAGEPILFLSVIGCCGGACHFPLPTNIAFCGHLSDPLRNNNQKTLQL